MDTKPWLTHYDQGIPQSLQPYPDKTLVDIVTETARQRPEHTALIFKGARLSYRELDRLTDAFAAALATLGVKKGDRVALVMPNSPQVIIAQTGRVESRSDRRAAQSDLHRARTRTRAE